MVIIFIQTYTVGTMTALVMMFAGITVAVLVFMIIVYRQHKLHQRNQETTQGSQCHASQSIYVFSIYI